MKSTVFVSTVFLSLSICTNGYSSGFDSPQDQSLAQDQKQVSELSPYSKYAIATGSMESAELLYAKTYKDAVLKVNHGAQALYQLVLIFVDEKNRLRDIKKARTYYEKLLAEYPEAPETQKAKNLMKKYS